MEVTVASNLTAEVFDRSGSTSGVVSMPTVGSEPTVTSTAGDVLELTLSIGAARAARAVRRGKRTLVLTKTMSEPKRGRKEEPQKIQEPFHPHSYTQQRRRAQMRTIQGSN
jgi:hypothetical protein